MSHDRDFEDLLLGATEGRFYGKYKGRVLSHDDSEKIGRLQVVVPAVMGEVPLWALPCVPYAGPGVGMFFLPPEDAQVWVEFEAGCPSHPIWTGCFWKPGELEGADHKPEIKLIKTDKITIRIDDQANSITIENSFGTVLEIVNGEISGKANTEISHQVAAIKASLTALKFDVNEGAMSVS